MKIKSSFKYSFKHSIPILLGFFPVGILYGILMASNGYNFIWTGACSIFVFAGSLQYLMIDFFSSSVSYFNIAVLALLLNSRHIFYGIPFLKKWSNYGPIKYFLIFALPDETFSLDVSNEITEELDEKAVFIFNALLVMIYWFVFTVIGALFGSFISFNTDGMDFALTALFAVITVDQFCNSKTPVPGIIALISAVICLIVLGPSYFILPSLIITIISLLLLRPKLEVVVQ